MHDLQEFVKYCGDDVSLAAQWMLYTRRHVSLVLRGKRPCTRLLAAMARSSLWAKQNHDATKAEDDRRFSLHRKLIEATR